MVQLFAISCTIMRGGTSKGIFLRMDDLPPEAEARDKIILALFGSPDVRQIDGLGGADSLTSKVAIIAPSLSPNYDVEYTFGQVGISQPIVDYRGNCGNISSAVGPYAMEKGLVKIAEPTTRVRILNTNTGKLICASVPAAGGKALYSGDYRIDGVPGTGARIELEFFDPAGSITGRLLPTGSATDEIRLRDGKVLAATLIDASNPAVFVKASELGLRGAELPDEISSKPGLLETIEEIRSIAAEMMHLVAERKEATAKSPSVPKIALVAEPRSYESMHGKRVSAGEMDIAARVMSMQKPHKAYSITCAIPTAVAAFLPGSVVNEVCAAKSASKIRIGHPSGAIEIGVKVKSEGGAFAVESVTVARTARLLMEGVAYLPSWKIWAK